MPLRVRASDDASVGATTTNDAAAAALQQSPPLPRTPLEMIEQAGDAVQRYMCFVIAVQVVMVGDGLGWFEECYLGRDIPTTCVYTPMFAHPTHTHTVHWIKASNAKNFNSSFQSTKKSLTFWQLNPSTIHVR